MLVDVTERVTVGVLVSVPLPVWDELTTVVLVATAVQAINHGLHLAFGLLLVTLAHSFGRVPLAASGEFKRENLLPDIAKLNCCDSLHLLRN